MNAPLTTNTKPDRTKFIGGMQSNRVSGLNEGVVRHLYESGMTQIEIAKTLNTSQRSVCLFMARCGIQARVAVKRDQRGEKNSYWRGNSIGYKSAHNRVASVRGKPQECERCGVSGSDFHYEWANVSGNYPDPNDYIRLCISCHRRWDHQRRKEKKA